MPDLATIGKPESVRPKEPDQPGYDTVRHKNIEASVPIQGITRILEVQEYLKDNRLPHGRKIMDQLGFNGGGTHPTACPKPVQHVMEHDG